MRGDKNDVNVKVWPTGIMIDKRGVYLKLK